MCTWIILAVAIAYKNTLHIIISKHMIYGHRIMIIFKQNVLFSPQVSTAFPIIINMYLYTYKSITYCLFCVGKADKHVIVLM